MAKITVTGLKRPPANLPHIDERDGNKTTTESDEDIEVLTYESSLPPAWLKLDASQLPQELAKLVGHATPGPARASRLVLTHWSILRAMKHQPSWSHLMKLSSSR